MDKKIYATEEEKIEHCKKYACNTCTIAHKCSMFEALFGYLPDAPNYPLDSDGKKPLQRSEKARPLN